MTTHSMSPETSGAAPTGLPTPEPHWLRRTLRRQPLGAVAAAYLVLLVLAGLLAPVIAPHPPAEQDLSTVLAGPSGAHWLGTDTVGRDVLSRLLYGIDPALVNTLIALAVFLLLGVPLGILAGYRGGPLDTAISRTAELVLGVPAIIFVLVVLGVFSSSSTAAMIALGVLGAPGLVRLVRGATLVVREELFVTAARVSGVRPSRIMSSHVLRRVLGPILAQTSVFAGVSLGFQAALAFLGVMSAGDRPSWGGMIGEASTVVTSDGWLLVPPGVVIALTVLAFGVLGDAIRDRTMGERTPAAPRARRKARGQGTKPTPAPTVPAPGKPDDGLLEVRGLTVTASTDGPDTTLVSDVTFGIDAGETVALVGESGCGKSMTALAVLGLLPDGVHVSGGEVLFRGTDLVDGGPKAYRAVRGSGIAYVAQDALGSLDPTHTIGSHLKEVIRRHERGSASETRARAAELLHQVRLPNVDRVLASYPHEISGGMAQRVNIALALAGRPRLVIADEPTTALDVTVQAEILALLRELQQSTGMAILLITHDWGVVADIADRAVVMYAGEVVEQAGVDRLFRAPRFPYTAALLAADPSTAAEGTRLPTLPGRVPPPGAWPTGCRFAGRCAHVREKCTGGPIPLLQVGRDTTTRCIRAEDLVREGASQC
ncbi:dipeptide/oligopeptide/nickel ABC transporter permease/ATP-binding protein [Streptomyces ipomoeae]|uniref:dipeptide/oligopeptide/nickel ABC transporter permease/ATP-binding protein n=1 Tax=Streptomyces ipomoeae TaxID=103232 RepID=UPI0011469EF1|nr:dipeptide/oligopeptide/nickel ABC transporter permease/ATP-binding protein [Streptomyces ipomoeae]MDX2939544.1 dipeptide/oligopeptide/nickel ABC transporter permease/ATP-binding protein [Streptomyces ipomoeae]TQE31012.1 dipeptide/oligopeptide/nickel ABC transporter permease/ATP-binding protein [Streptomyces ipomoeae]